MMTSPAQKILSRVIESGHWVASTYIQDLSDADLLVRSVPGANHIAWQLGHMIAGTHKMLAMAGYPTPALPQGFAEAYTPQTASCDDPTKFTTKAEYLALMNQAKEAALAAIETTPDADLDKPGPEAMRDYAPTVGAVLMLQGTHWLMHAGQFVPIRRKLGKKPIF
jgi:hypothetical protein